MKDKKKVLIFVVILAVIILIGLGIFWSVTKKSGPNGLFAINPDQIVLSNLNSDTEKNLLADTLAKLKTNPQDVESLITLATMQKYNQSFDDAIKTLEYAKQSQTENTTIYNNLGELYIITGNFTQAEKNYLDLIAFNSQWLNAYIWLNDIYKERMPDVFKSDKFPNLLKKGLDESVTNKAAFLQLLGNYYRDTGDKSEAINYYEQFLKLDPKNADVQTELNKLR